MNDQDGDSMGPSDPEVDPWKAINQKMALAQSYLTERAYPHPDWEGMPWATWHKTGDELSTAKSGEPRCGAKAVDVKFFSNTSLGVVTRTYVTCIRPPGHVGPHASAVRQHPIRSHIWDACLWS